MRARTIHLFLAILGLLLFSQIVLVGQIEVEPALTDPRTPENLIRQVFGGKGVDIISVQFAGERQAVGYFNNGTNDIGIEEGFIMTTGRALLASQPNDAPGDGDINQSTATDPTIASITTDDIRDLAIYEIEFIPKNDTIEFNYVFASEEYPEFGCDCFNDVFGFFLQGPGYPDFTNIAIVPGTVDDPVSIRNIHPLDPDGGNEGVCLDGELPDCNPVNEQFYIDNTGSATLTYDGLTTLLTAKAAVQRCQTYTIKLAIADVRDEIFDSAIFFEANSFGSESLEVTTTTESFDGTLIEGCAGGSITFSFDEPVEENYQVGISFVGNAVRGVDVDISPLTDIIPAGESSLTLDISALTDEIAEPLDSIGFEVVLNDCETETYWFFIRDTELEGLDLGEDQSVCLGDSIGLNGALNLEESQEVSFQSPSGSTIINTIDNRDTDITGNTTSSTIQVSGVRSDEIREGLIQEVCVQILHNNIEDIDLFLETPSGDLLELSTDNGGGGSNMMTCFTPNAATNITNGTPPFMGDFLPEGNWEELYGGTVNGDWTLYIKDDSRGTDGVFRDWSITFNPLYQLTYQWTPTDGLSCTDCPNPNAAPDADTEYELAITDSYGCSIRDTIVVRTTLDTTPIVINCVNESLDNVTFQWEVTPNVAYEINEAGQGWIPAATPGMHVVSGLEQGETVALQVRGTDGSCINEAGEAECTTSLCFPPEATIQAFDLFCYDGEDGELQATASDPNVIFILDTDTSFSGRFSGLLAGDYTVIVLDTLTTCSITLDAVINRPDSIVLDTFKTIASCGQNDAIAAIIPSGGTMPYQILWDNGQGTDTIRNLGPGTYTVQLTDDFNCTANQTITIEADDTQDTVGISIVCAEVTSNSLTFSWTPVGDVALYEVKVADEAWTTASANTSITVPNLSILETVQIQVRGSSECTFVLDSMSCTTADCTPPTGTFDVVREGACTDFTDGAITISSLSPNIVYILNTDTSTTGVFEDLAPGAYNFILLDTVTQCSTPLDTQLMNPTPLMVETFTQSETCGEQDGIAAVIPTGGTPPYQINWSTGEVGDTISNLATGTYSVTIIDDRGCIQERMLLVDLDVEGFEDLRIQVTCADVTNNSILFVWDAVPTVTEYEVNVNNTGWIMPNGDLSHELRGLGFSEIYNLQVRGNSDCGGAVLGNQICVTSNCLPPTISIGEENNLSCNGADDGSINIVINTFPFEFVDTIPFVIVDSAGFNVIDFSQTQEVILTSPTIGFVILGTDTILATEENPMVVFENLAPGTYTIELLDTLLSCRSSQDFTIEEPDSVELMTNFEGPVSCPGADDGVIVVVANGGTAPFTYDWNADGINDGDVQTDLSPGEYTVLATDVNGCTIEASYIVEEPEPIMPELFQANIGCGESNTGTLGIVPDPNFNYSVEWSTGATTDTIFDLPPGDYQGTVTTDAGCTTTVSATIEAVTLELFTDVTEPLCGNPNLETSLITGNAYVTAVGNPAGQFEYNWSSGATTDTAFMLTPGEYFVTVTDITTDCILTDTINIAAPESLEVVLLNNTDETCNGAEDGSAEFSIIGGTPNYSIDWGDGETSSMPSRNDLVGGNYTVTITDDNGCTTSLDLTIATPIPIELTITTTPIDCQNETGTATVEATGGTGELTYLWNDDSLQITPTATGLSEDIFQVVVTDEANCTAIEEVIIERILPFDFELTSTPSTCTAGGTATVEITTGGSDNFSYLWNDSNAQTTPEATDLAPGNYTVLVTDLDAGCEELLPVTVEDDSDELFLSFTTQEAGCNGEADGSTEAMVSGGTPGYSYLWSTGASTNAITNLVAGEYMLTVTDQNGCTTLDTVNVASPDAIVGVANVNNITCNGDRDGAIVISASGGSGNLEYSIDGSRFFADSMFNGLNASNYLVRVRDENGCLLDLGSFQITEPAPIGVSLTGNNILEANTPTSLFVQVFNAQGRVDYDWTSDNEPSSLSCTDCADPTATPQIGQTYSVSVTDSLGCQADAELSVLVRVDRAVFVPTGFTPNGDITNDRLTVHGKEGTLVLNFKIFDRWGELVYENGGFNVNEMAAGWDGNFRGEAMNGGVYTWIADVRYEDGLTETVKGHSTLIR